MSDLHRRKRTQPAQRGSLPEAPAAFAVGAARERGDPGLYISARYLRGLFDHLRARRVSLEPVLAVIGLSDAELSEPDRHIPHALQDEIFAAAERATGDPDIGLHAGETTHVMHFGIIGQLALTCASGRELLDLQVRFQSLIGNGLRSTLIEAADEVVLRFQCRDPQKARHSIEYSIAAQITLARLLAGPSFAMTSFELPYAATAHPQEQARVFACPIRYARPVMQGHFAREVLALRLAGHDGGARAALEAEARRRLDALRVALPDDDAFVARLKRQIAERLSSGAPSVEDAARTLGTSVRSLQRELESRSLTYRELIDLTRREIAERLMRDVSLSLLDVALLLGFADQTAFHRAFRRWFSSAPGEYRARLSSRRPQ